MSSFTFYLHSESSESYPSPKVLIFFFVLSQVTATWPCQTTWEVTHLMFFCVWVSHGLLRQRRGMHLLRSAVVDYLCRVFSSWYLWLLPFFGLYLNNWVLNQKVGCIFLVIYFIFLGTSVSMEMYVFGRFRLPMCTIEV